MLKETSYQPALDYSKTEEIFINGSSGIVLAGPLAKINFFSMKAKKKGVEPFPILILTMTTEDLLKLNDHLSIVLYNAYKNGDLPGKVFKGEKINLRDKND